MAIESAIHALGFPDPVDVRGRLSIADVLLKSHNRCGIYLLEFSDGFFYIGQAKDAVRRFGQHRKRHDNIIRWSFQPVKQVNLDSVEQELIHRVAPLGLILTNKVHVSHVVGETDLDELVSPDEQQAWLADPSRFKTELDRIDIDPSGSHRMRYKREWGLLQSRPDFAEILRVLRTYARGSVPAYRLTEYSFWSVSCMPSTNANSYPRLAAINMNIMETLVVYYPKGEQDNVNVFVNVAKSRILETYASEYKMRLQFSGVSWTETSYRAAGEDQMSIRTNSLRAAIRLLADPVVSGAAALLNLRLMRKGGNIYARYHCFDLADRISEEEGSRAS